MSDQQFGALHSASSGALHSASSGALHGASSGALHGASSGALHSASSGALHSAVAGLFPVPNWPSLLGVLDASPALVAIFMGPEHVLAYQNPVSIALQGQRGIGKPAVEAFPDHPEWLTELDRVYTTGEPVRFSRAPMRTSGVAPRLMLLDAIYTPLRAGSSDSPIVGVVAHALDITATKVDEGRLRQLISLSRVGVELSRSLELDQVIDTVTRLAAEVFDGWSLLDLWRPDGTLHRVRGRHHSPAMQPVLDEMLSLPRISGRPGGNAESIAARVSRTGEAAAGRFDAEQLAAVATSPRHAELMRTLRPGPYLIVPVQVGARRLGALSVMRRIGGSAFSPEDRLVAEQYAERAAIALAHANDYDEQRQAALTLQRSLLPSVLPAVTGASLAVRYRAGAAGAEVGGDWYDVFETAPGVLGIVIGDVEGHDLAAAALMSQIRSVVHTHARSGRSPAAVAERANEFLAELDTDRLVTFTYAQVDLDKRLVVWVRAGHMPVLAVPPGGAAQVLYGRGGLPLGVDPHATWAEDTMRLPPGTLVALFTDGLVETVDTPLSKGVARLGALLAGPEAGQPCCAHGTADLDALADAILAGLDEHQRGAAPSSPDDAAFVLLRLMPHSGRCG